MSGSTKKELSAQVARLNRKLKEAEENHDASFKYLEARDALEADLKAKLAKAELELGQWRRTARSAFICRDTMIKYNRTSTEARAKLIDERNKLRLELRKAQGLFEGEGSLNRTRTQAYFDERKRAEDLLQELNKADIRVAELERELALSISAEERAQDRHQEAFEALKNSEQLSDVRLRGWVGEQQLHDETKKLLEKNEGRIKNIVDDVLQRRAEAAEERATSASRDLDLSLANNRALRTVIHDQAQRHIESYCTWRRRIREAEERAATADRKLEQLRASAGKAADVLKEAADKLSVRLAPMYCDLLDYVMDVDKILDSVLSNPVYSVDAPINAHLKASFTALRKLRGCSPLAETPGVWKNHAPTGSAYDLQVKKGTPVPCEHTVVLGGPGTKTCKYCGVVMQFDGRGYVPVTVQEPAGCKVETQKFMEGPIAPIFIIDGEQYTPLTNEMMVTFGDSWISSLYAAGRIRQHDVGGSTGKVIRVVEVL
jgi:hypothetical protein